MANTFGGLNTALRGVRKVSENVLQEGRALVFNEESSDILWSDIPNGSIKVADDGTLQYKQKGQTSWLPIGIKNDGTIAIAKDSVIRQEVFTITSVSKDKFEYSFINDNGTTGYWSPSAEDWEVYFTLNTDNMRFPFRLQKGSYQPDRNLLEVWIDGVLRRTVNDGGITQITEKEFVLNDYLEVGQTVTVYYTCIARMGTPYPRIFLQATMPTTGEDGQAEIGDFWLDTNYDDNLDPESTEPMITFQWCDIVGKPYTLSDFGLLQEVYDIVDNHSVFYSQIKGTAPPTKANGGNADTVGGYYPGKNGADKVLVTDNNGKIDPSVVGPHLLNALGIYVQANTPPSSAVDGSLWFDTTTSNESIKVKVTGTWIPFGAVWK